MPREYNISWNAAQRKRLNSAARRYNNAIRRVVRNNPLAKEFLPDEVSYKELRSEIKTARALRNKVNKLLRATRPGALDFVRQDDGSLVTEYERREFAILRSVRERKKSMEAREQGLAQPERGIGTIDQAMVSRDARPIGSFSARALRRFIETQEREMNRSNWEKAERYFRNYVSALYSVFGGFSRFDADVSEVVGKIRKLIERGDFKEVKAAVKRSPGIDYIYDPLTREAKMEKVLEYWRGVE